MDGLTKIPVLLCASQPDISQLTCHVKPGQAHWGAYLASPCYIVLFARLVYRHRAKESGVGTQCRRWEMKRQVFGRIK